MYTYLALSAFKAFFVRDFPYGTDISTSVTDADINRALAEAQATINEELFYNQETFTLGNEYLAAHNLAMNLRESSQGLASQFEWGVSSKGVGSVSVGMSLPSSILDNPQYAYYSRTSYGVKYLMLIIPMMVGRVFSVTGATQA